MKSHTQRNHRRQSQGCHPPPREVGGDEAGIVSYAVYEAGVAPVEELEAQLVATSTLIGTAWVSTS
jgi:hypothetical protein